MQLVVFEDAGFWDLLPLVYTRATFDLRCGCDRLLDKIETAIGRRADAVFVRESLADVVDERQRTEAARPRAVNRAPDGEDQLWVNGRLLVYDRIDLAPGSVVWSGETLIAARVDRGTAAGLTPGDTAALQSALASLNRVDLSADAASLVRYPWQLVHANEAEIVRQAAGMTRGRAARIDSGACLLQEDDICIGSGSRIKPGAVLDAEAGPIQIGRQVTVGPTATITGPCV
ncbi:MAG: putative sugar nucleotidyl transferase, partial [Phycisphaerae bacterium]